MKLFSLFHTLPATSQNLDPLPAQIQAGSGKSSRYGLIGRAPATTEKKCRAKENIYFPEKTITMATTVTFDAALGVGGNITTYSCLGPVYKIRSIN